MNIYISNSSDKPIYEQIILQIKNAILSGQLGPGDALPSLRYLAKELKVSIISTKRAYEELEHDGYIQSVPGKGSFVTEKNRELMKEEQFKKVEQYLQCAAETARLSDISLEEMMGVLKLLYEE